MPREKAVEGACYPMEPFDFLNSFPSFSTYLEAKGLFLITPGLERIARTLEELHLTSLPCPVVQIVGTNGKGSTTTMLASLAKEHGLKTGVHLSPHFSSVRERITIGGALLPETEWLECAAVLRCAGGDELSYFEYLTALALVAFSRNKVDIVLLETGLGGTWDATTAVAADVVLFTPIDLDHMAVLGRSRTAIAKDKAGAIRPRCMVLSVPQPRDVWDELASAADAKQATLCCSTGTRETLPSYLEGHAVHVAWPCARGKEDGTLPPLGLAGQHQYVNAALALGAWRYLQQNAFGKNFCATASLPSDNDAELRGLARAWLPGRLQMVPASTKYTVAPPAAFSLPLLGEAPDARVAFPVGGGKTVFRPLPYPPMILDGAHNAHGLSHLGLALAQRKIAPLAVIFSCLKDKDVPQLVAHVRSFATGAMFIPPIKDNPRAMPPDKLASLLGVNAYPTASLEEALYLASAHMAERMPDMAEREPFSNPLLVCGSLYLLGELYSLRPDLLLPPDFCSKAP